jgi:hypothetical protein
MPALPSAIRGFARLGRLLDRHPVRLSSRRHEAELCPGGAELKAAVADRAATRDAMVTRPSPSRPFRGRGIESLIHGKTSFLAIVRTLPLPNIARSFEAGKNPYPGARNDFAKIGRGQKLLLLQGPRVNRDGLLLLRGFLPGLAGSPPKVQHYPRVFGERPSPQP